MFTGYFSILTTLTATVVYAFPNPSSDKPVGHIKREEVAVPLNTALPDLSNIRLNVTFGDHTRFRDDLPQDIVVPLGGSDLAAQGKEKEFSWFGYDEQPLPTHFKWFILDKNADEGDLRDENIKFRMNCTAQLLAERQVGKEFTVELNTEPPFIHPTGRTGWNDILNSASVTCEAGECMTDCDGLVMPTWNQTYLQNFRF